LDSTGGRGGGVQNVSDWNAGGNAAASVVFDVAAVSDVAAVPDAAASILFEAVTDAAAVIVAVPDAVTVLDTAAASDAAASDAAASDAAAVTVFAAGAASGKNKSVGGDVLIPLGVEVVVDA